MSWLFETLGIFEEYKVFIGTILSNKTVADEDVDIVDWPTEADLVDGTSATISYISNFIFGSNLLYIRLPVPEALLKVLYCEKALS